MSGAQRIPPGAIAIVGLAGRFPGAEDVRALWRNLLAGVEGIRRLDQAELERAGIPPELRRARGFVPVAADLADVERFDAAFFALAPREAAVLDPQQKLLCELAWEACEDAGVVPRRFTGAVGVFVGASRSDWGARVRADPAHEAALGAFAIDLLTSRDFLATRLAWVLGCEGPCLTVQSACSTSLVAVHLACQSLLAGESDLALAGGVSVRLPQAQGYLFVEGGVASRDGHCRAFDARASGTVPGNGGALVCLKRLEDALADGDPIVAVLRGTAVNNDGTAKLGFTAPSVAGQRAVIEEALAVADLDAAAIGYVEAHGTGTPLGDPIEVAALSAAFAGVRGPCGLGSLKTNLGHLDAAAGIAGLVKAALCVAHGRIPASLHFERANPALELEASPFRVVAETSDWLGPLPRRAGVSSFGIGGTNAHAIVEQPPARAPLVPAPAELLLFSAATPQALAQSAARLAERLGADDAPALAETAWTLQSGRSAFRWRAALVARDPGEACARLSAFEPAQALEAGAGARPCAFLFPGQGALPLAALRALVRADEGLRAHWTTIAALARPLGVDLERLLEAPEAPGSTAQAQPLLFALELVLARRLEALGLAPAALLGHSLGELVAASVAGVFGLADALALVVERGRLMEAAPRGAMLSVALGAAELEPLLGAGLEIAGWLAPRLTVAAGGEAEIAALEAALDRRRAAHRRIGVRHAFHTPAMEAAAEGFTAAVARVERHAPRIPWLSNLSGDWIEPERARDPAYWGAALRSPVRLAEGIARLAERAELVALELGPGGTFAPGLRPLGKPVVAFFPRAGEPSGTGEDATSFLAALGRAWQHGVDVDWRALDGRAKRRVSLPCYPFQRERSWIDPPAAEAPTGAAAASGAAAAGESGFPQPPRSQSVWPPGVGGNPVGREGGSQGPPGPAGAATEDDARALLAALWRELLGVPRVRDEDDFLALGGSSLAAIQLAAWLEERAGKRVAPARLAATPRFADQLALLREPAQASAGWIALAEPPAGMECLPPLVLVHGIDGEVLPFAPLARALAGGRPPRAILGLRSSALAGGALPDDVRSLAADAERALRAELGAVSVQVGGHSFGALVALELARLLRADGRLCDPLLLLDAGLVADGDPPLEEALLAAEAHGRPALDAGVDPARRAQLFLAHARAAERYRPLPYEGPVRLILAQDGAGRQRERVLARWRRVLRDCEAHDVPGDHLSFLARPRELAATISPGLALGNRP